MNWRVIKNIGKLAWLMIALAVVGNVIIFSFVEYGAKNDTFVGCFAYDAMLLGFRCQGFILSDVITAWLNWPLWLLYAPLFAIFSLRAALLAALIWVLPLMYIVATNRLRSETGITDQK